MTDDTVWTTNKQSNIYHTDEDCDCLPENHRTLRRVIAESWETYRVCKYCSDSAKRDRDYRDTVCADCGSRAARFAPHHPDDWVCGHCREQNSPVRSAKNLYRSGGTR